jgi:hypothetical protein
MWTLTHPENRPCGYAVEMLRKTSLKRCRAKARAIARLWLLMPEVDSSKLLLPRYTHVAALLP